ncbi:hypothetical protein GCM10027275_20700 [Rhabdobacter roseus]
MFLTLYTHILVKPGSFGKVLLLAVLNLVGVVAYSETPTIIISRVYLSCVDGNLGIDVEFQSAGQVTASAGTLVSNGSRNYTLKGLAAGELVLIEAVSAQDTARLEYLVPVVEPAPLLPPLVASQVLCSEDPTPPLSAFVGENQTVDWYDAPTDGNLLGTGLTFTPAAPGRYYAETRDTTRSCFNRSTERSAVQVEVLPKTLCIITSGERLR